MNKKKMFLVVCSVFVVTLAFAGTTLALLSTQTQAKANGFVPGVLTSQIFENGSLAPDGHSSLIPTENTTLKEVQVQNTPGAHEVDAYIRVMLVPTFRSDEGTLAGNISLNPNNDSIIIEAPSGETVTLNLTSGWNNNWISQNGYFYYKSIVSPGDLTDVLLESVHVTNTELWQTFNLEVLSDAIQAENGAALDAWGTIAEQLQ
ncbi:hypothetical protein GC105_02435 [Alkalibaculum sp. M08DMB]|uniref:Uncharacterized protein n=1 Tax=Alkalibaculum sporogenes TaxID=2655001 RepID=A0A6A7K5M7_9FIRM|nr:hypothetical protein [Alkalibaculum sporogenes]MPW24651.1 hypothetical protein [Alkalibaculum sporogenes]